MRIGVITGSGTNVLPGLQADSTRAVDTRFGAAQVSIGQWRGVEIVHVSRHGDGHARLSSHVNHRANVLALRELQVDAVIGVTICGALDPQIELGSLIVFDDLHFLANRLADGSICSLHDRPQASRTRTLGLRPAVLAAAARSPAERRFSRCSDGTRRWLLRARRRPALQHARRDPHARRVRRERGQPDGRAGDRSVRRGRAPLRAARLRDRLRQRRRR